MGLEIEIDEAGRFVVMRIQGQMTAAELAVDYQKLFEEKAFEVSMDVLWDLSGIQLTRVPISEFRALPKVLGAHSERRGENYKAAIFTRRGSDYQLLRVYLGLLKLIGNFRVRVFNSEQAAKHWLASSSPS